MIILVTFTIGMILWILAWAMGIKPFDAFLFTALITMMAAGVRITMPYVDRVTKRAPATPGER